MTSTASHRPNRRRIGTTIGAALAAAAADWSRPDKGEYLLKNSAVPGWRTLQVSSGTVLFDDLVVARISPQTSPWYKRLLGLAPSSGDRIVGLTPAPGPMRRVR